MVSILKKTTILTLLTVLMILVSACRTGSTSASESENDNSGQPTGYSFDKYPQSKLRYNGDLYEFSNPSVLLPDDAVLVGKISAVIEDGQIPQNDFEATNSETGLPVYLVTDHESFLVDKDGNMTPYTYLSVERAERVYLIYYRSSN